MRRDDNFSFFLVGERLEERRIKTTEKLEEAGNSGKDRPVKGDNWEQGSTV